MYRFFLIFIFATFLNTQPLFSQNDNLNMSISTAFNSGNVLGVYNNLRTQNKSNINLNLEYSKKSLSSQFSLSFDDHNNLIFDNSYINYQKGITNLNIGKVDRIWSFSKKSSLILSSNGRPLEAISINLKNEFNMKWLPSTAKWSVELVNGSTNNSLEGENSVLSGARAIISPHENLNFEFLQTSQWGNKNDKLYSSDIGAFLLDSNEGKNANINRMAGFGISYSMPLNEKTYRLYVQTIGEDEAGSLPSCLSWMAGLELTIPEMRFPTTLSIEAVDTRVKKSTHGNCGVNTMYNNAVYDYINYDTVIGVPIDTEGASLEVFGQSQINKNLSIKLFIKVSFD